MGETLSSFKSITYLKELSPSQVLRDYEILSKSNSDLMIFFGIDNIIDLHYYLLDGLLEKKKQKDFSKLKPVKRKIMRNGKEVEVTIWEKPGEGGDDDDEGGGGGENEEQHDPNKPIPAHVLPKSTIKRNEIPYKEIETLGLRSGGFTPTSPDYLKFDGDNNLALIGYSETDDAIVIEDYTQHLVNHVLLNAIRQLAIEAYRRDKSLIILMGAIKDDIDYGIVQVMGLEEMEDGTGYVWEKEYIYDVLSPASSMIKEEDVDK